MLNKIALITSIIAFIISVFAYYGKYSKELGGNLEKLNYISHQCFENEKNISQNIQEINNNINEISNIKIINSSLNQTLEKINKDIEDIDREIKELYDQIIISNERAIEVLKDALEETKNK